MTFERRMTHLFAIIVSEGYHSVSRLGEYEYKDILRNSPVIHRRDSRILVHRIPGYVDVESSDVLLDCLSDERIGVCRDLYGVSRDDQG